MPLRLSLILVLALASAGCFPQKAPHRPVTAHSLEADNPGAVEFLDLHDSAGTVLPDTLPAFKSLTQLSLRNTGLAAAPAGLASLPLLTWLDLGENKLAAFPDPALIPNVDTLYLADNALTELPPAIGQLGKLTYLNLDRNQLTRLPDEIGNLAALKYLRLNGNKLEALPESIGKLKNLKRLYIKGTGLPPAERSKLTALLPGVEVIGD